MTTNELLAAFVAAAGEPGPAGSVRDALVARYAFAVPDDEALAAVADSSPDGVLELGAGTGYWARLLADRGVDVLAVDPHPAPDADNPWFAGAEPWYPVAVGDVSMVDEQPQRTLLLVWPTRDETWAAEAARRYHAAGGAHLVYVGEGPGGRTGDDVFHALVGALDRCVVHAYGVTDAVCICDVPRLWREQRRVTLPRWRGFADDLIVYTRA